MLPHLRCGSTEQSAALYSPWTSPARLPPWTQAATLVAQQLHTTPPKRQPSTQEVKHARHHDLPADLSGLSSAAAPLLHKVSGNPVHPR